MAPLSLKQHRSKIWPPPVPLSTENRSQAVELRRGADLSRGRLETLKVFCGFDQREAVGFHVCLQSIIERTDLPFEIVPLSERIGKRLGIGCGDSTNAFGKLRFAVPFLCGFRGYAIWLDCADMLLLADLAELYEKRESWYGLKVVKHDYQTKHSRKYIGTDLEAANLDYPKKNQSSVMLWTCDYAPHRKLTPEFIDRQPAGYLHRFSWMPEERVGELPAEWNHLVDEQPYDVNAKLVHFTLGQPGFEHYGDCDYAGQWKQTMLDSQEGMQYQITVKP